jgi:hypothetical protein
VTRRGATTWSPGLIVTIALTYLTIALVFFATGYLAGRLLL